MRWAWSFYREWMPLPTAIMPMRVHRRMHEAALRGDLAASQAIYGEWNL